MHERDPSPDVHALRGSPARDFGSIVNVEMTAPRGLYPLGSSICLNSSRVSGLSSRWYSADTFT